MKSMELSFPTFSREFPTKVFEHSQMIPGEWQIGKLKYLFIAFSQDSTMYSYENSTSKHFPSFPDTKQRGRRECSKTFVGNSREKVGKLNSIDFT